MKASSRAASPIWCAARAARMWRARLILAPRCGSEARSPMREAGAAPRHLPTCARPSSARPLRDPKTMLQEWAQGRGLPTPSYREVERKGPHHNPEFRVAVDVPKLVPAEGIGRSKRAAEQAAAAAMLTREGVEANG